MAKEIIPTSGMIASVLRPMTHDLGWLNLFMRKLPNSWAFDSGSKCSGLSRGRSVERSSALIWPVHCVVFLGKTLTLTVPLSTLEYKWVPANCQGNSTEELVRLALRWIVAFFSEEVF